MEGNLPFFVFEGNFPSTSLRGGLYSEGRFNGGLFALPVWGLIFGGAYTWRGLFSEFYGFGEILPEKPQNLQRTYELINVLPSSNLQFLIAAIFFVTDCKGLKLAESVFEPNWYIPLHLLWVNSYANEQKCHDVTMYPPILSAIGYLW